MSNHVTEPLTSDLVQLSLLISAAWLWTCREIVSLLELPIATQRKTKMA